jgi:hypothetical protein
MEDKLRLSNEERVVIDAFIDTFEKKAKQWKSRRYIVLLGALMALFSGLFYLNDFIDHSLFRKDKFLDRLKQETVPTDVPLEYWVAGYVNKIATVYEHQQNFDSFCLFEGVLGVLMIVCFMTSTVILISRWNNDKRDMIVVKIMRHYLKGWES